MDKSVLSTVIYTLPNKAVRSETAWYVCTRHLRAPAAADAIRDHWLVEKWPVAADDVCPEWPGIRCLIRVQRRTEVFHTTRAAWQVRSETAWYVCTRHLRAPAAADAIRDHWLVENALHHVRDVTFAEDASRIRRQPGVFAQLRTWAFNLLRHAGHDNIKAARQTFGWAPDLLLNLCRNL